MERQSDCINKTVTKDQRSANDLPQAHEVTCRHTAIHSALRLATIIKITVES